MRITEIIKGRGGYALMLAVSLTLLAGCSDRSSSGQAENTASLAQAEVVYKGVLPCADCEGIETIVTLHDGNRYTLSTRYLVEGEQASEQRGTFTRHAQESRIVLDDGRQFKQGQDSLIQLTTEGQTVIGELSEFYVLKQIQ